jgi:tripartite-type tricarboxylate transporter receptor subunit TctC
MEVTMARKLRTLFVWLSVLGAIGILFQGTRASAAAYPRKPIQLIYPWPAGSGGDIATRLLADHVSKVLGVPVKVTNMPGGQGTIGTAKLVKATPDGYEIGSLPIGPAVTQPIFAPDLPYKTSDLAPICQFTYLPVVLIARADAPFNTFKEFFEYAKQHSGELKYAHPGVGAVPYLDMVALEKQGGFNMVGVPYKGLAPGVTAVVGGHVDLAPAVLSGVVEFQKAAKLKILALFSSKRLDTAPQVPSVEEFGVKVYPKLWTGIFAPKGLKPEVFSRLSEAFATAVKDHDFLKAMATAKQPVDYLDAKAFAARIEKDRVYFEGLVEKKK